MTDNKVNDLRYQFLIEDLKFIEISDEVFKTKDGKEHNWRKLVTLDGMNENCNFTLHKECSIDPELGEEKLGHPVRVIVGKDRFRKEKVLAVELM